MALPRILRTTSFRFAALYVLLFAASALVLGLVVFVVAREAMLGQMRARIEAETALLTREYAQDGLAGLAVTVTHRGRGAGALDYRLQDAAGRRLAGEIPAIGAERGWFDMTIDEAFREEARPEHLRVHAVTLGDGAVLAIGDDLARVTEVQEAILRAFAAAIGATILLGAAGGLLLSRAFLSRVDAIVRTAEAIIDGDLSRRVQLGGTGDDLDHLAATLNRMLDRIAALMESLKQVSADIAHDLRTPLSRLLQRLEEVRSGPATLGAYEAAIEAAAAEAMGLLDTFAALLRIAQVEGGERRASFRQLDLSQIAETVAEAFLPAVEDERHVLRTAIAPGIALRGDKELLSQALANLIENALRHTPAGTHIHLGLCRDAAGQAVLCVADDGPGVPAAEQGRVLQRFYRCEQSRSSEGNGLGLSLVAAIAELHDARLTLEDAAPGLRVVLVFPAVGAPTFN